MPIYSGYRYDDAQPEWYKTAKEAFDGTRDGQTRFFISLKEEDIERLKSGLLLAVATNEDHVIIAWGESHEPNIPRL